MTDDEDNGDEQPEQEPDAADRQVGSDVDGDPASGTSESPDDEAADSDVGSEEEEASTPDSPESPDADEPEPADRQVGSDVDEASTPDSSGSQDDESEADPQVGSEEEEASTSDLSETSVFDDPDRPETDAEIIEEIEAEIEAAHAGKQTEDEPSGSDEGSQAEPEDVEPDEEPPTEPDQEAPTEPAAEIEEPPEEELTEDEPASDDGSGVDRGDVEAVDEAPAEPVGEEPEQPPAEIESAEAQPLEEEPEDTEASATVEDAVIEEIEEAESVQPYAEPGGVEVSKDAPTTPSEETLGVVEEISPAEIEAVDAAGEPRRAPHGSELEEALGLELSEPITPVPEIDDPAIEIVDTSEIRKGITYVRLLFDEDASRYLYQVVEPPLTEGEADDLAFIRETLVQTLASRDPDAEVDWRSYLQDAVTQIIEEHGLELEPVSVARVNYYLERDFLGYGPIDVMMQDPMIEDISCDGPGIPIYVFHRELESTRTNVTFEEEEFLDGFVRSLAQRSGRHISIAEPILDATLPDTSRLQATLSEEVTTRGSSFTIRRFRADPLTTPDLVRLGTMSARMAAWIWMAVESGSPMLVAGGTASGKTTTLSSMTQFIPPAKKVVTIEDTREFSLVHENWVASLTRAGGFGAGEERAIDMYKLLRTALRQRPEYLVVGEVRGSEAQTLFQAMATGHATYSTMHADSVRSAVYRLENPPIDIPRMMLQTLDAVIVQGQTRIDDRLVRRVLDITEIVGIDDKTGDVLTNQVYGWSPKGDEFSFRGRSNVLEELRLRRNTTVDEIEKDWSRRTRVMEWMVEQGIRHITDVSHVIAAYYASPERLIERIEEGAGQTAIPEPEELEPVGDDLGQREATGS